MRKVCCWTDGEECDSSMLLCYSFSNSSVLTPVEFTQAARVAEGADRPRLPAAPALHPTFCRPDPTSRSLRRNAAPSHYIIPARGGLKQRLFLFSIAACTHIHAHSHTYIQCTDKGAMQALPLVIPISSPCIASPPTGNAVGLHTLTKLGTFTILLYMLLSVQCRLEKEGGRDGKREGGREAERR